jgi:plastocyanin
MLFCTAGCREKEEPTDSGAPAAAAAPESKGKPAFPKAQAAASITGKVIFDGEVPTPKALRIQGDKFCEHHAADNPLKSETLLVNDDQTLRNVFVHITKGLDQWAFEVPSQPVVVTQKGCTYRPHVLGVQVGQTLHLTSEDNTTHNVHFIGKRNREFNLTQKQGQVDEKRFTRREVGTAFLKCDIHSWMKAHIGIVGHPFYAVTGDGGTFALGELPAGEYEVQVWHETLGSQTQTVTVQDGETAALEFSLGQK